ncbi:MAG: hypothetical protein Q7T36_15470 [Fluviicoccus sp.]|uniref:hypothetical protein n=1 Tax=Fluviicoccus sp. TaxID=2003552 RepID=UPI002718E204|nr:hypothetical protein [Fluviicoccus sp.]MDO8331864.1 hypothetical protein [Fluviicoccus sp.]
MKSMGWLSLLMAGSLAACDTVKSDMPTGVSPLTKDHPVLTVPGAVNTKDRYLEMPVEVRGFDGGWQGGCKTAPPVSRSDWQLVDGGSCLYVHGPKPEAAPAVNGKPRLLKVVGTLRESRDGVLYISIP